MPSSGMLRHVALARTEVSKERIVSIIRVTRIGELGRTLAVTSSQSTGFQCSTSRKGKIISIAKSLRADYGASQIKLALTITKQEDSLRMMKCLLLLESKGLSRLCITEPQGLLTLFIVKNSE
jgi:hypothetical protein